MKVRIIDIPNAKKRVRIVKAPKMQTGGKPLQETGGLPPEMADQANIEAENGEVYQNTEGSYTKISDQAPDHENGGVLIGDAERVLEDTSMDRKDKHSKALLMSPGEVESIFGFRPKRGVSHAKAFELAKGHFDKKRGTFQTAQKDLNDQKLMDKFSINSAQQNFVNREFVPNDDDIFNTLFEHQEAIKEVNDIPTGGPKQKYGGFKYKMQVGGTAASPEDYYKSSATLAYYKNKLNEKLKAKDPTAFQNYFQGLVKARQTGNPAAAEQYTQQSQYNAYLTPEEVQTTLGANDYQKYLQALKGVNQYNVQQSEQPLYGTVEGENDLSNLNYGRRFASLQVTPSFGQTVKREGAANKNYSRNYNYNPETGTVDFTETGDVSLRPEGFSSRQFGGFKYEPKPKFQVAGYAGGKTKAGSTTPGGNPNAFAFPGGLDAYKKAWQPIIDMGQFNTAADAQEATYNYLLDNDWDIVSDMWQKQGLTQKGQDMRNPKSKLYNKDFAKVADQFFDKSGRFKTSEASNFTPGRLSELAPAYVDDNLGVRSIAPSTETATEVTKPTPGDTGVAGSNPEPGSPGKQRKEPSVNVNPRFINQPKNAFSEPTRWYDLAPGVMSLLDSLNRDPELYNPVQLHQLKYKLLNPTAALQANQADFNAAAQALGNQNVGAGVQSANMANLLAQKYKANNQIMADYENRNAAITNQEIAYNTGVQDRQSLADAQSREKYYTDVLKGRDNQRLQKLQAIQDLSRVAQLKARQNRSGNLILKMTPAFDQNGEYNGYQYVPVRMDQNQFEFIPKKAAPKSKSTAAKTKTTTTSKIGNRVIKQTTSE